ncbi:hypothetical protein [Candidatus Rhabdochlamydia sp. T3358]|jgi:hypothetical protein|uniref:hypothetical protein n=1 Tax=Candidatus Rhabdochlamydia sp. T3358 TaxID=2099795 RepID=UPI0010BAF462|nr:hypothetical protein [Candidatus Rhabdochlamydia sp. T3358]VHO04410.1 hypothetical protein RHT_01373 [Candidatus Rhabdochlamydia sp. T3358]
MIRITGSFPSSPLPFQDPIKKIQKQLYDSVGQFKTKLQSLDAIKAKDPQFLEEFAHGTIQLNSIVEKIEESSRTSSEDLKDAAYIMHNILYQSLYSPNSASETTLLKAATDFKIEENSDLSLVLHNFTKHPNRLEMLIQELTVIMEDLEN